MEYPEPHADGYYHLQIFKEDFVYRKRSDYVDRRKQKISDDSTRGEIKAFSKKSKLRLMHQLRNSQHSFKQFITLTYPKTHPIDGVEVKAHLNAFLTRLRQEFKGLHYLWVIEAQKRGAPHFHIIINAELPTERLEGYRDTIKHYSRIWSKRWSVITGNANNSKHLRRGLRIDPITSNNPKALAAYMAKYYTKNEQKDFGPKYRDVGRYWGASRGFATPIAQGIYLASEFKWMLQLCFHHANLERAKAGYSRYRYSVDRGTAIWGITEVFATKIWPLFKERFDSPYMGLEKPPTKLQNMPRHNKFHIRMRSINLMLTFIKKFGVVSLCTVNNTSP